jgi:hypothetical protein
MDNWIKLKKLNREERKLLVQALFLLPVVHWCLGWIGYFRLANLVEKYLALKPAPENPSRNDLFERAEVAAHMVSFAARHGFFQASCLRRSMALVILLRRQNIDSKLCLGTRLSDHILEAHAWVEVQGIIVNDRPDVREQYTALSGNLLPTKKGL